MQKWEDGENPLQDTFLVKVKEIDKISDVADELKNMQGVSIVKYGEGMIEQLIVVFEVVRQVSLFIVVALVVVTAFLISNTIKLAIFARKREIEIMRLVGASNSNIKIPFIIEGLFLGIIGSVIPIIATIYGYVSLYENFDGQLFSPFIKLVTPQPFIYLVSGILLSIGILVGMFGSWRAVRKYLKI
jgi:cell division transport system permease protein